MSSPHRPRTPPAPSVPTPPIDPVPAPGAMPGCANTFTLAGRSILKIGRTPEQLVGRSRCSRSSSWCCSSTSSAARSPGSRTATCSSSCRRSWRRRSSSRRWRSASTSTPTSKQGVFDRFRSLPIARSAPLVGAVLGDIVRYAVSVVSSPGVRHTARLPDPDQPAVGAGRRACSCCSSRSHVLGLGSARDDRRAARRGAGVRLPDDVPADVRQQHVVPAASCRAGCRRGSRSTR